MDGWLIGWSRYIFHVSNSRSMFMVDLMDVHLIGCMELSLCRRIYTCIIIVPTITFCDWAFGLFCECIILVTSICQHCCQDRGIDPYRLHNTNGLCLRYSRLWKLRHCVSNSLVRLFNYLWAVRSHLEHPSRSGGVSKNSLIICSEAYIDYHPPKATMLMEVS